jgi:hypothetical protein
MVAIHKTCYEFLMVKARVGVPYPKSDEDILSCPVVIKAPKP